MAEVRERVVRMVLAHEAEHPSRWSAVQSISGKIGCSPHTLLAWVEKADRDAGRTPGIPSGVMAKLKPARRRIRISEQGPSPVRHVLLDCNDIDVTACYAF